MGKEHRSSEHRAQKVIFYILTLHYRAPSAWWQIEVTGFIEAAERFTADPLSESAGGFWKGSDRFWESFRRILAGSGRILAGLREEVGWIRQSRADFGRKIADSRGDLVACPGGYRGGECGGELRNARGAY